MSIGTTYSPAVPVGGVTKCKVTNFDLCLHIVMATGKCTEASMGFFWLGES